jgi:hypothetical protein
MPTISTYGFQGAVCVASGASILAIRCGASLLREKNIDLSKVGNSVILSSLALSIIGMGVGLTTNDEEDTAPMNASKTASSNDSTLINVLKATILSVGIGIGLGLANAPIK